MVGPASSYSLLAIHICWKVDSEAKMDYGHAANRMGQRVVRNNVAPTIESSTHSSDPDRVLSLGRSDNLDLHRRRSQGGDLLLHTVGCGVAYHVTLRTCRQPKPSPSTNVMHCAGLTDTVVHGGTSGHDDVSVQVLPDVQVTLHDRVVGRLVDSASLETEEAGLEQGLGSSEPARKVGKKAYHISTELT
jgi:hypothetical protein